MDPLPDGNPAAEKRSANSSSRTFAAVDRLTAGYLLLTLLLVALRASRIPHAGSIAIVNSALLGVVWLISRRRESGPRPWRIAAEWYPLACFVIFFEQIGSLVHALVDDWYDAMLISADYAAFGAHPTVWIEQYASHWLTEYMQFSYFMYFPLTAAVAAWLRWRHGRAALGELFLASCLAYYSCYVIFVIFPVEGPYHTLRELQQVELRGGWFDSVMQWIERYGRVHGGVFPSAHVAGSVVALLVTARYSPRLAALLAPLVMSIMVATVYGRYHYAVDVPAGALVAIAGVVVAGRYARPHRRANGPQPTADRRVEPWEQR
jgi:membrane-associated phospholipid phosphatase